MLLPLACAASLAVAVPAYARDDAGRNMIIGGIAGALIGENNHHHAAEGAVIGATAGLLLTAIADNNGHERRSEVYYDSAPACHRDVVVSRPYCPPAPRVVVVYPAHHRSGYSREVVVVRPAQRHAPREAVVESYGRREDRREARYEDRRSDRREYRSSPPEYRRDDRREDHNRGSDHDRYAYYR